MIASLEANEELLDGCMFPALQDEKISYVVCSDVYALTTVTMASMVNSHVYGHTEKFKVNLKNKAHV